MTKESEIADDIVELEKKASIFHRTFGIGSSDIKKFVACVYGYNKFPHDFKFRNLTKKDYCSKLQKFYKVYKKDIFNLIIRLKGERAGKNIFAKIYYILFGKIWKIEEAVKHKEKRREYYDILTTISEFPDKHLGSNMDNPSIRKKLAFDLFIEIKNTIRRATEIDGINKSEGLIIVYIKNALKKLMRASKSGYTNQSFERYQKEFMDLVDEDLRSLIKAKIKALEKEAARVAV